MSKTHRVIKQKYDILASLTRCNTIGKYEEKRRFSRGFCYSVCRSDTFFFNKSSLVIADSQSLGPLALYILYEVFCEPKFNFLH